MLLLELLKEASFSSISASLEKIAGPATTPATTSEKNAPKESTSLFAENSHMMTMIPETLAHEMVNAEQKLATALSDGEIPIGNSLGVSHSEIHAEPAAISSVTTNLTDGIDLGGAVSVEETSIYAHHGEDVVANFDYVSPDASFTLQLTSGDSAATLPLTHEAAPQEGISRVVSGVSQDNVPFISGIVSVGSNLLQCTHCGMQRVINGVTSEKMEILGGLSAAVAGQQQTPGKEAWEDAPEHISKDSLPQPLASLENQEFHQEDSTSHHITQQDFVPKEMHHKRDICSVIEVVSGVTSGNMAIVSDLSSTSRHTDVDLRCPKGGKEFELPSIKVIVSGITADGVELISGLVSEHCTATASSECGKGSEIRADSHSGGAANVINAGGMTASRAATHQVVSGLTSDSQQIIA